MRNEIRYIYYLLIASIIFNSCTLGHRKSEYIFKNGEITFGTIYDKTTIRTQKERKYFVKFDFVYKNGLIKFHCCPVNRNIYNFLFLTLS